MYNYTKNQHLNLPDQYSITLRITRPWVMRGGNQSLLLGVFVTKINVSSGIKIDNNLYLSLSFRKREPQRDRSPTQSAHQFGKPTAMPRGVVNLWNIHFIFTCSALSWTTRTKAGKDSLLNVYLEFWMYFYVSVTWVPFFPSFTAYFGAVNLNSGNGNGS